MAVPMAQSKAGSAGELSAAVRSALAAGVEAEEAGSQGPRCRRPWTWNIHYILYHVLYSEICTILH